MRRIRYYNSFTDDFEQSANQNFKLPQNYKWVKTNLTSKILAEIIYGLAVIFGGLYCKFVLHIKIIGRKNLKGIKGGFLIYGNHTQPVGDVFIPALCVLPKRIYTVVSTANYGIPFIGKILQYLGALPIVDTLSGIKELNRAIEYRLNNGNPIVVYPEAHVWEYYTGIRPFADTSFKFAVKYNVPAFAMTVTYKKSKIFKKPTTEVFIDGPFYAQGDTTKSKVCNLHNIVFETMKSRAENSNYEYIKYVKNSDKD